MAWPLRRSHRNWEFPVMNKGPENLPDWLKQWKRFTETKRSYHQIPNLDLELRDKIQKDILRDQVYSKKRILGILLISLLSLMIAILFF